MISVKYFLTDSLIVFSKSRANGLYFKWLYDCLFFCNYAGLYEKVTCMHQVVNILEAS